MSEAQATFAATLPVRERRLAGRIEGFGDIVFGFAVSQCALELPSDHGHVDLSQPLALVLYFGTFALIASLWLIFHRLMSSAFVPTGIDLFGAFAFLALVSLMPFAMYAMTHALQSQAAARAALAEYATLYGAVTAIAAGLTARNLQRGWHFFDAPERDRVWISLVRRCILTVLMWTASVLALAFGPVTASVALGAIPFAIRVARLRFKHAPAFVMPRA